MPPDHFTARAPSRPSQLPPQRGGERAQARPLAAGLGEPRQRGSRRARRAGGDRGLQQDAGVRGLLLDPPVLLAPDAGRAPDRARPPARTAPPRAGERYRRAGARPRSARPCRGRRGIGVGWSRAAPWATRASARRSSRPSSLLSSLRPAPPPPPRGRRRGTGPRARRARRRRPGRGRAAAAGAPRRRAGRPTTAARSASAPPPTPPRRRTAREAQLARERRGGAARPAGHAQQRRPARRHHQRRRQRLEARAARQPLRVPPAHAEHDRARQPGLRIIRRRGDQAIQIGQRRLELVTRLPDRGPQQQRLGGRLGLVPPRRAAPPRARPRKRGSPPLRAAAISIRARRDAVARSRGFGVQRATQAGALRGGRIAPARRHLGHDLAIGDLRAPSTRPPRTRLRPTRSPCPPRPRPARTTTTPAAARRSRLCASAVMTAGR